MKHFGRLTAAYEALDYVPAPRSTRARLAASQGANVST